MSRVSLRDIANLAGVAPSTVSLVLNGKAKKMRISEDLTKKIKAIAKKSGYIPNQTAVSLRTGRSKILGLIVEDISNVFFASLAKIIEAKANSLGFTIVYCSTDNNDKKGCELIKTLLHKQVDGFLITPSKGMMHEVHALLELKKPVVLMDRFFPQLDNAYVLVDNYSGVGLGIAHLLESGYRTIGYITNDLEQNQMQERERAYRETLIHNGIGIDEGQIFRLPYDIKNEEAVQRIAAFLRSTPQLDAVFFATNYLGVYGLESIQQLGYVIPEDLAVVCFDDHEIFRLMAPGITCVRQPVDEIGNAAVQFLLQQFGGNAPPPEQLRQLVKPSLVVRGSV